MTKKSHLQWLFVKGVHRACVTAHLSSASTLWGCCLAEAVNALVIFWK